MRKLDSLQAVRDAGESITVTRPFMPPLEEFVPYLESIWRNRWLTNAGAYHQELEEALCAYLGVKHLALFANGTIGLVTALQALRITGEVITTPYSFVATAHSLIWNSLTPVFVDIDAVTCNLDPEKIEQAITPRTTAIVPVHCYGNPCNVEEIQKIADTYGLKVIYDAAHAFGVKYKGGSILNHGDLSVLSFHATNLFTTFEGGAIVCHNAKMKQRIDYLKNFGFADEVTVMAPGINGKMNEVQAAFGLLQLKYVDRVMEQRRAVDLVYRKALAEVRGIRLFEYHPECTRNGSFFPVFVDESFRITRDELYAALRAENILARRYFYPLISAFPMYRGFPSASPDNLSVASCMSNQTLCLPIYADLSEGQQQRVIDIIRG